MTKKGYQKRLPTILPPAPRAAPEEESFPVSGSGRAEAPATTTPAVERPAPPPMPAPALPPVTAVDPPAPPLAPRTRTRLLVLVSAAVLLAVAAGGVAVWVTAGDDEPATTAPRAGWPRAGESRVETQVRADGVIEVTHWVHASTPLSKIDLLLPEPPERDAIRVSEVEVVADGATASGPADLDFVAFRRASYVFADATRIRVAYEMAGAVERSDSAPGRGLVTTTALEVSPPQQRDLRVVRSEAVLSLACASAPDTSLQPCGESDGDDQWQVDLTGQAAGARVVAAVTVSP